MLRFLDFGHRFGFPDFLSLEAFLRHFVLGVQGLPIKHKSRKFLLCHDANLAPEIVDPKGLSVTHALGVGGEHMADKVRVKTA